MPTNAAHSEIPATGPRSFMLTFDDGPVPGKTDAVLATLRRYLGEDGQPVRAGFFMVGDAPVGFWPGRRYYAPYEIWIHKGSMRRHPEIVARVRAAGHLIGNHTTHHIWPRWPWYRSEARLTAELQAWETIAREAAEQDPTARAGDESTTVSPRNESPRNESTRLFRTPYLADTPELTRVAQTLGYQIIGGETVGDASPEHTAQDVLKRVQHLMETPQNDKTPVVLIFHDILPLTVNHLGDVIDCLLDRGYALRHFDPAHLAD